MSIEKIIAETVGQSIQPLIEKVLADIEIKKAYLDRMDEFPYKVDMVALMTGVSKNTIYNRIDAGEFKAEKNSNESSTITFKQFKHLIK